MQNEPHYLQRELRDLLRSDSSIFEFLQKSTLDGLWFWDLENPEVEWMNDGFWELLGYDPGSKKHLASEWQDLIHPDDLETALDNFNKHCADSNHAYDQIVRYKHCDGSMVCVRCRGMAVRDATGKPIRMLGAHNDISELMRAEQDLRLANDELELRVQERTTELQQANENLSRQITELGHVKEALRKSEGWFNSLMSNIAGAVYRCACDKDWTTEFMSEAIEDISGYPASDFIESRVRSYASIIHPDDRAMVEETAIQAVDRKQPFTVQYRIHNAKGEVRRVWENGTGVFDDGGGLLYLDGAIYDVTGQRRAEEALRESEARHRELFDESPVAVWVEDWSAIKRMFDDLARGGVKDWRGYFDSHRDQLKTAYDLSNVLEISNATIKLYRAESREHILQMTAAEVVIDEELGAFREMVLSCLAGRMTLEIEAKDTAGDGSDIFLRRRMVIPPKYRDDWSRVIYAIEDITESKRAEEQLRHAQKMEAVGQLTAGVAHDFNNMLAVTWGNAELLEDEIGKDNPHLAALFGATKRGAELTQRLLAFSRKQVLNPETVNANNLIVETASLLRSTLEAHIDIETVTAADLWNCEVDPAQLENALVNLAINARDAMPEGGKLTIETTNAQLDDDYAAAQAEVRPGQYVMLAITDTGSGMPLEVRERVFEPFFTTKEVGKGSGLGLSMVYGFVKQSGGHVTIYSEQGAGTTIKLYLPRSTKTEVAEKKPAPVARGETVLVVEDDPDMRTLAVSLLSGLGYQVMEAATGAAALEHLGSTTRANLLLTDVILAGGMNGRELATEVQRRVPGIPVLYMSGYTDGEIVLHGRLDADAELLQKPFRRADLARAVRKVLDASSA